MNDKHVGHSATLHDGDLIVHVRKPRNSIEICRTRNFRYLAEEHNNEWRLDRINWSKLYIGAFINTPTGHPQSRILRHICLYNLL
jgi:hypothetical protein